MSSINLVFPHQLFEEHPLLENKHYFYLVEEHLFFQQYKFHQQKIAFHRASMKYFESYLTQKGKGVHYIDCTDEVSDIRKLIASLAEKGITDIHFVEATDDWLSGRLMDSAKQHNIQLHRHESPLFLNTQDEIKSYFLEKGKFYQTDFYIHQRKTRNLLLTDDQKPEGGKWSFDSENRKKYPRKKTPPAIQFPKENEFYHEAKAYTTQHFGKNYGELAANFHYPSTHEEADKWLDNFLHTRFDEFGPYEDAVAAEETFLHHSILTPMLNVGLITPEHIIEKTLAYRNNHPDLALNSLEGFIRQIVGWREFMRGVYELKGREERTKNFWGFDRKIPSSFWDGTTGIDPIDITIKKVLKTGYCHHIERLMVLGNFMLLCEFDPDEVYRWFMELFIDAYDWVMVPNVYGMSQFADGGLMSTKPYISGSNYLKKMSDHKNGEWQEIWDALFWRFLYQHQDFFSKNPRMNMLVKTFEKWPKEKKDQYLNTAKNYLISISIQE